MEKGAIYVEEKAVAGAKDVEEGAEEVKSALMTFLPETPNNKNVSETNPPDTTSTENTNVADKQVQEKAGSTIKQKVQEAGTFLRNEAVEVMKDAKEEFQELKNELNPCDISRHYTIE